MPEAAGGLWPKAARQGQGWAGSEGSGRVRELGRAGPSRAERGHAPTAAIMGWRGPGEGGGSGGGEGRQWVLWDGEAFCGGGGKGEPRLLWDGEAFRHRRGAGGWQEYYGMASPSAAGGGWGGGVILWDRGAPRGSGNGGGGWKWGWEDAAIMGWQGPLQPERVEYYGVAQFPARVPGRLLWDGAVPTASLRNIMGCGGQGEGSAIMGCRRSTGRGGGPQLRPPCRVRRVRRVPPVPAGPRPVPPRGPSPPPRPPSSSQPVAPAGYYGMAAPPVRGCGRGGAVAMEHFP